MGCSHLKLHETRESHLSQNQIIKMKAVQYFRRLSAGPLNVQSSTAVNITLKIILHFPPIPVESPFPPPLCVV